MIDELLCGYHDTVPAIIHLPGICDRPTLTRLLLNVIAHIADGAMEGTDRHERNHGGKLEVCSACIRLLDTGTVEGHMTA